MNKKIFFIIIAILAVVAGAFWFWQSQKNATEIKSSEDFAASTELRIGVAAMITPSEGKRYYEDLANWLAKKTDREPKLIFKKSYQEMNDAIEAKEVDIAFICAGPYVEGKKKFGLELLAAPMVDGKNTYNSYIIANKNSAINKFEDLKGKTFAFTDPQSNTGTLVPTYMVAKLGGTPETFFSKLIYTGSHDASISAVANGVIDGAAVDSLIFDYIKERKPGLVEEVKIIEESPPFGIPMVVVHPDFNQDLKSRLRGLLLSANSDSQIKDALVNMEIEKFTLIDDSAYNSIREMINFIETKKQ
jgi:phosphonate transport system substrate-binding protein